MMIDDAADRFRDAYGIEDLTDPSAISEASRHVISPTFRAHSSHVVGLDIRLWPDHLHSYRYG